MRVLVLGGTGPSGLLVIRQCLEANYAPVVVYARSPHKIPEDISSNIDVVIVKGELEDTDALAPAMEGVDVVLSALGPSPMPGSHPSGNPIARGYSSVIKVMEQLGVKRLIILGTISITDPSDKFDLVFRTLVTGISIIARNAYNDIVAIGEVVRTEGSELDWTIARVATLTSKESRDVRAGYIGDGKSKPWISRSAFAAFLIAEAEKGEWVKKAPFICSPGGK